MPVVSYREALNQAMDEEMARDERVFLMGEEVAQYNGAYKVSQGLLAKSVRSGLSIRRLQKPDFPALESVLQWWVSARSLNLCPGIFLLLPSIKLSINAAKMLSMSGGNFNVPIVFRGPGGAAHNLAATHSQALESLYAHFPGLKVVMPSNPRDAKGLLKTAIRDNNPVIFIESEVMYRRESEINEGEYTIPLGAGEIIQEGKDVTIVSLSKVAGAYCNESCQPACGRKHQR